MAVEAIGATGTSTSTARTEFQRAQQKLTADLANRAADKVAAADKAAITRTEKADLQERQTTSPTVRIGEGGSTLDLVI